MVGLTTLVIVNHIITMALGALHRSTLRVAADMLLGSAGQRLRRIYDDVVEDAAYRSSMSSLALSSFKPWRAAPPLRAPGAGGPAHPRPSGRQAAAWVAHAMAGARGGVFALELDDSVPACTQS